jgi:hypothetical protein
MTAAGLPQKARPDARREKIGGSKLRAKATYSIIFVQSLATARFVRG